MPSRTVRAHRRQFVLWKQAVRPTPDWRCVGLGTSGILSHCRDLPVAHLTDADGAAWTLLGTALSADARHETPASLLSETPTHGIEQAIESWAGRWLLIGRTRIYPDSTALLGCLFGRDDAGDLLVTSSPALSAAIGVAEPRPVADARILVHERGLSWFPPPRTRFAGVARLLPSQYLDRASGRPAPRRLLPPVAEVPDEVRLDEIVACLSNTLRRLPTVADELHLGLSAGADSRALLAAGAAAGVALRPFTRLTARMSAADRVLPPKLAATAGLAHRYVRDRPVTEDRRSMLRDHAAESVAVADVLPFLSGVRDGLPGVMTNGAGFELVSGFANWRRLASRLPPPEQAATAICKLHGESADSPARAGLESWVDWVRHHPAEGLDWRDRLYLEQRRCGWEAAKEQVYDMQDVLRLPVLNCARTWALMLSLPEELRLAKGVQTAIIARCAPALLEFPFNPGDRAFFLTRPDLVARRRLHLAGRRLARRR